MELNAHLVSYGLIFFSILALMMGLAWVGRKSIWFVGGALTILSGLSIGMVSAYFSIAGLMALFAGSAIAVAIMATTLEVGKFFLAAILHFFWKKMSGLLKIAATAMMAVLMLLTSIGIFGFLSQAHLKHGEKTDLSDVRIETLKTQKAGKEKEIGSLEKQIDTIRAGVFGVMSQGYVKSGIKAKNDMSTDIEKIDAERVRIQGERNAIAREVGPLKYVAELIWASGDDDSMGKAVRLMILLIMFVFDPFAVILFLMGTMMVHQGLTTYKFRQARARTNMKRTNPIAKAKRSSTTPRKPVTATTMNESALVTKMAARRQLTEPVLNEMTVAETTDGKAWGRTRLTVAKGGRPKVDEGKE